MTSGTLTAKDKPVAHTVRDEITNLNRSRWLSSLLTSAAIVLAVGVLYWAREVLIPIALAVLLAFILVPLVKRLRRLGIGKKPAVVLTVLFALALVICMGALLITEFTGLAGELPRYQGNIRKKIGDYHLAMRNPTAKRLQGMVQEIVNDLTREDILGNTNNPAVPVVVKNSGPGVDGAFLGNIVEYGARAGLLIILVVFILLRREDLRDRILGLADQARLADVTKAVDESSERVSRYLLRQFLVNSGYGTLIGIGLWLIGLPYALLWGFFAGLARFIPYAGPIIGASPPILMSLAVFDSWTAPLAVIGLIACLEFTVAMVIEPIVYGQGIGVSEVALLVMIAFWTWLWGPVGLILAAPMTVCLMVVSESIPRFRFISTLLRQTPGMEPRRMLYHRMIARDPLGARDVIEKFLRHHSRAEMFNDLLLPALVSTRRDRNQGKLTAEDTKFVYGLAEEIIAAPKENELTTPEEVVGFPVTEKADELALLMLSEILRAEKRRMRVVSSDAALAAILQTDAVQPTLICVSFLPGGPCRNAQRLCQDLRARFPDKPIFLGRWQGRDRRKIKCHLARIEVDLGWTLQESARQIVEYFDEKKPRTRNSPPPPPAASRKLEVEFLEQQS